MLVAILRAMSEYGVAMEGFWVVRMRSGVPRAVDWSFPGLGQSDATGKTDAKRDISEAEVIRRRKFTRKSWIKKQRVTSK